MLKTKFCASAAAFRGGGGGAGVGGPRVGGGSQCTAIARICYRPLTAAAVADICARTSFVTGRAAGIIGQ